MYDLKVEKVKKALIEGVKAQSRHESYNLQAMHYAAKLVIQSSCYEGLMYTISGRNCFNIKIDGEVIPEGYTWHFNKVSMLRSYAGAFQVKDSIE